jgi:carboxypeptidase D
MTWGGKQGFQKPIVDDSFLVDGMGAMGTSQLERKLAYVEIVLSGHMVPEYSPVVRILNLASVLDCRIIPPPPDCLPDYAILVRHERQALETDTFG